MKNAKNSENKYPEYIIQDLRQRRGLEPDDTSEDKDINTLSPNEAFYEVCQWDGLLGYDSTIKNWIKDIYKVDLDRGIFLD